MIELKPRRRVLAVALAMAMAMCACALAGCGSKALEDADDKALAAAEAQFGEGSGFEGYAANDYVNPSGYRVTKVEVSDAKADGASVSGKASVTVENDSFQSVGTYDLTAQAAESGDWSDVSFTLVEQQTEPVKGIDFDEERGITSDSNIDFARGPKTCAAKVPSADADSWIMTSGKVDVYNYTFDGERWSFTEETEEQGDAVCNLAGTYLGDYGDGTTKLEIEHPITVEDSTIEVGDYLYSRSFPKYGIDVGFRSDGASYLRDSSSGPILELEDVGGGYLGFDCYWNDLERSGAIAVGGLVHFQGVLDPNTPDEIRVFDYGDPDLSKASDRVEAAWSSVTTNGQLALAYTTPLEHWYPDKPDESWNRNTKFVLKRS